MSSYRSLTIGFVFVVTSMLVFFTTYSVQAATINNWPADANDSFGFFGGGYGTKYFAQSFISPVSGLVEKLDLIFELSDMNTFNTTDVLFSVLLTETEYTGTDILPKNDPLGNSGVLALTGEACTDGECTVSFTDLSLTNDGSTYAWVLEAANGSDYGSVGSRAGYTGGHYFTAQNYTDAWADPLNGEGDLLDLAFIIDITPAPAPVLVAPVPAALPLMLSGLVGMGLLGRRVRK
ncbi:VPLPA-CTERM sorting domain-containing protein [bacterium]|nr:VPLPA-CTERM sorting domain-containing protein [bacterium]